MDHNIVKSYTSCLLLPPLNNQIPLHTFDVWNLFCTGISSWLTYREKQSNFHLARLFLKPLAFHAFLLHNHAHRSDGLGHLKFRAIANDPANL